MHFPFISLSLSLPYTVSPFLSFCLFNLLKTLIKRWAGAWKGGDCCRLFPLFVLFKKKISCAYPSPADLLTSARHAGAVSSRFPHFHSTFPRPAFVCLGCGACVTTICATCDLQHPPSLPPFALLLRLLRVLTKY